MNAVLDNFLSAWGYCLMIPSFILSIVGFGFLFSVRWGNPKNKNKTLKVGAILFGQVFLIWGIMGIGNAFMQNRVRKELKVFLNQPNLIIKINGEIINKPDSDSIAKELMKIKKMSGHRSSPIDMFQIELISNGTSVIIDLGQDDNIKNEYWIFWKKYRMTSNNEIGRIRTEVFAK